jgi:hypothetical protein
VSTMIKNKFSAAEFSIDDTGVSFIRSNFPYKTLSFSEIQEIRINKRNIINNSIIILIAGIIFVGIGIYLILDFNINSDTVSLSGRAYKVIAFLIMMVLFFLLAGLLLIYQAFKKDVVMNIKLGNTSETFPLTILRENNQLNIFINYLKQTVGNKLIIEITNDVHPSSDDSRTVQS